MRRTLPLPRRMRLNRHRVYRRLQLLRQKLINHPVPLEPRFAFEGLGHYFYTEMRFAFAVEMRLVPGVEVAFVDDFEALGRQRGFKLLLNI